MQVKLTRSNLKNLLELGMFVAQHLEEDEFVDTLYEYSRCEFESIDEDDILELKPFFDDMCKRLEYSVDNLMISEEGQEEFKNAVSKMYDL